MQFLSKFFYDVAIVRVLDNSFKLLYPMRYFFTSPTEDSSYKCIIEYRAKARTCPDREIPNLRIQRKSRAIGDKEKSNRRGHNGNHEAMSSSEEGDSHEEESKVEDLALTVRQKELIEEYNRKEEEYK